VASADADTIRVVIADDHEGIRRLLGVRIKLDGRLAVVGEAKDGGEAIAVVTGTLPDAVVIDLDMPVASGFEVIPHLRDALPDLKIVVLSGAFALDELTLSMTRGADAFLSKRGELAYVIPTVVDLVRGAGQAERGA
jgi:DNA-binding NarL/FixJ family response regulator